MPCAWPWHRLFGSFPVRIGICREPPVSSSSALAASLDAMRLGGSNPGTARRHGSAVTRRVARRSPPHSSRRFPHQHAQICACARARSAASSAFACPSPATVRASYYGPGFNSRRTASGSIFRQGDFTAAHRSWRFGTKVRVTNLRNGRDVVVTIADRGPYVRGRQPGSLRRRGPGHRRDRRGLGPPRSDVRNRRTRSRASGSLRRVDRGQDLVERGAHAVGVGR